MEPTEEKLLKDFTDVEKGAYISAIASIATADRSASEEELDFLEALADASDLSPEQRLNVRDAALETSPEILKSNLDTLKGSELRFSLLTDLVAFAESDNDYSDQERKNIENIASYLGINQQQYSAINQYVQQSAEGGTNEEPMALSAGTKDQFQKAGINIGSITKGLLGMVGPMILGSLLSRGMGRSGGGLGGMLGGMLGSGAAGNTGGLGGMLGSGGLGGMLGGGGLGSLIGMLSGGRGIKSTGGLLGGLFGR